MDPLLPLRETCERRRDVCVPDGRRVVEQGDKAELLALEMVRDVALLDPKPVEPGHVFPFWGI